LAPYMIDFPFSPVLGGLVISERTWNRIPSQFHRELKAAIEIVAKDFYVESERLNTEAMKVMNNNGLQLEKLTASEEQDWFDVMISGHALVVGDGKWVDKEIYDAFISELEEMR
jgi:TRAP-type C4-dicarboxylate transport system substrate-binding protein